MTIVTNILVRPKSGGWGRGGGGGMVARYLILAALSMLQTIPPFSFLVGFFVFGWGVNIKYKSY